MNIRISADSTCDLSPELIEKYDIRITPLYIVRDGQSLVDGKDITPDEIYAHVNSGGFTPEELAQVEAAVRSCQPFDEVLHTRAGCTVSSHCGPRTLGILYFHTK